MFVVFLTGGLASGKTTVAAWLVEKGAIVLDLDQIAKQEQETAAVLVELTIAFGSDIVDTQGKLDRKLLAERAFVSKQNADKLNAICWPPVTKRLSEYINQARSDQHMEQRLVVVQVPMLVEASALIPLADEIVTVSAPEELRLDRALERGMTGLDARRRLNNQAADAKREAIADTVFHNSGSLEQLFEAVDDWYFAHQKAGHFDV
ncbi:MAG: dephospho-CoA kinase [Coriobacteriales bacterium]|jgi:dephospho-CoA kinase|nr:dephospho-CoA kinase [Coriobacteriales bacterium]